MCIGYVQIIGYFIQRTGTPVDFGICRGPETNPPQILRNHFITYIGIHVLNQCKLYTMLSISPSYHNVHYFERTYWWG